MFVTVYDLLIEFFFIDSHSVVDTADDGNDESEIVRIEAEESVSPVDMEVADEEESTKIQTAFQCDICEKSFKTKRTLQRHQTVHTGEKPFKCTLCPGEFTRKEGLQAHMLIHTGEKPFQCKRCDFRSRSSYNIALHQKIHDRGTVYRCSECEFSSIVKRDMIGHLLGTHGTGKWYVCSHCWFGFTSSESLASHMDKTHPEISHICPTCGLRFSSSHMLERHKISHTDYKPFKCAVCHKQFRRSENLRNHMKAHEDGGRSEKFTCKLCDFACVSQRTLNDHLLFAHQKKPFQFKCSACDFSTPVGRAVVAAHIAEFHADEEDTTSVLVVEIEPARAKCKICDKTFARNTSLKRHMLLHTDASKQHHCTICDRRFTRKDHLDGHMHWHNATYLYCSHCDFKTMNSSTLSKHVQSWHKASEFNCSRCESVFTVRDDLAVHMFETHDVKKVFYCSHCPYGFAERMELCAHTELKHTDVKIYSCTECSEKFIRNSSYRRHVKTQHSTVQPYHCQECGRSFNRSDKLKAHIKARHSKAKSVPETQTKDVVANKDGVSSTEEKLVKVADVNKSDSKYEAADDVWRCYGCKMVLPSEAALIDHYMTTHRGEQFALDTNPEKSVAEILDSQPEKDDSLTEVADSQEEITHNQTVVQQSPTRMQTNIPDSLQRIAQNQIDLSNKQSTGADVSTSHSQTTNDPLNQCFICSKTFERRPYLLRHMRKKHRISIKNGYLSSEGTSQPVHVEHKVKAYKCEECGDMFSRNSALLRHTRSRHSNQKPFSCKLCSKEFTRNEALVKHLQAHQDGNNMPFQCHICGHGFTKESSLNKHIITHNAK